MKLKHTWLIVLLLPLLLSSCNDSDDVQKIFTGRTWKLTYISEKDKHGWYKFPGVSEEVYQSYDPITGKRYFEIDFEGSTDDNVITGTFTGRGSVTMNGTFKANGRTNDYLANISKSSSGNGDTLGPFIIDGMKKAVSYTGDTRNLYLYFEYNSTTLCLVFAPSN